MLIIGAKLTAFKIEVPSYKIRYRKQQQQKLFDACLSISLHFGQARMKKIVKFSTVYTLLARGHLRGFYF